MIEQIMGTQIDGIKKYVKDCIPRLSLPYRYIPSSTTDSLVHLVLMEIENVASSLDGKIFGLSEKGVIVALAAIRLQEWEARVLGDSAYRMSLWILKECGDLVKLVKCVVSSVSEKASRSLITAKCCSSETKVIHALEGNGFLLMDTLADVFYLKNEHSRSDSCAIPMPDGLCIRNARLDDENGLRDLAKEAFHNHFGRFHADSNIATSTATSVYQEWISSCIHGWADLIFVAEDTSTKHLAGFSAWKKPSSEELSHGNNLGHYSIGAVSSAFAGRGLFKHLTQTGMDALKDCSAIEGPTHINNIPVLCGYISLGWKIADSRHAFHAWIN